MYRYRTWGAAKESCAAYAVMICEKWVCTMALLRVVCCVGFPVAVSNGGGTPRISRA